MAGNCTPPYACGTGGFCNCNCKCIRPCGNYSCCVENITYKYTIYFNYAEKPCCPTARVDVDIEFLLETDGCCFTPYESPLGTMMELRVVGNGVLKITPGSHYQDSGCFCVPTDLSCDVPGTKPIVYATILNITTGYSCTLSEAAALAGENLECGVNDCDSIQIFFQPTASWQGTCCCAGGPSGYILGNDIGNTCSSGMPMRRNRTTMLGLKYQILSRIKKVRYKP
jgi:hypothetical protein